jgi:hypothetical protein
MAGRYDISGILMAVAEKKANERARNQQIDLEREKMALTETFQNKQLEIQDKTATAQASYYDAQSANLKDEILLKKRMNPNVKVKDYTKQSQQFVPGIDFSMFADEKGEAPLTALSGYLESGMRFKLTKDQMANEITRSEILRKQANSEDWKNKVDKFNYEQAMAAVDAEKRVYAAHSEPIYDDKGNPVGAKIHSQVDLSAIKKATVPKEKLSTKDAAIKTALSFAHGLIPDVQGNSIPSMAFAATRALIGVEQSTKLTAQTQDAVKKTVEPFVKHFNDAFGTTMNELASSRPAPRSFATILPEWAASVTALLNEPAIKDANPQYRKQLLGIVQDITIYSQRLDAAQKARIDDILIQKGKYQTAPMPEQN